MGREVKKGTSTKEMLVLGQNELRSPGAMIGRKAHINSADGGPRTRACGMEPSSLGRANSTGIARAFHHRQFSNF